MHFSIVIDVCLFDVTLLLNITLAHGLYCHWYLCLEGQPVALEVRQRWEYRLQDKHFKRLATDATSGASSYHVLYYRKSVPVLRSLLVCMHSLKCMQYKGISSSRPSPPHTINDYLTTRQHVTTHGSTGLNLSALVSTWPNHASRWRPKHTYETNRLC